MIRAVVENGMIRPLEPLPAEWIEGRKVIVEDGDSAAPDAIETWYRELERLGSAEYEPGEWNHMNNVLSEADEQAKAQVRREMGLQ